VVGGGAGGCAGTFPIDSFNGLTYRRGIVDIARRAGLVVVALAAVWVSIDMEPAPLRRSRARGRS
jgi:hypothetical protein